MGGSGQSSGPTSAGVNVSTQHHSITTTAIQNQVGGKYTAGQSYYRNGRLLDLRREGETLKGRCRGQSGGPYRMRATLKDGAVVEADCSCPVGDGGHCKHVAAMLIAWQQEPESYRAGDDLDTTLGRLDKN